MCKDGQEIFDFFFFFFCVKGILLFVPFPILQSTLKKKQYWGPVVGTPRFHWRLGSIPGLEIKSCKPRGAAKKNNIAVYLDTFLYQNIKI